MQRRGGQLTVVKLLLMWGLADSVIRTSDKSTILRKAMTALDCRNPSSVSTGLLAQICDQEKDSKEGELEDVVMLYASTKHSVKATRCTKRTTTLNMVCGAFSHDKILAPPSVLEAQVFDPAECKDTVSRLLYTKPDGNSIPVEPNREYEYKFILHGSLTLTTDNVRCEGASILINGERHDAVVTLVTEVVTFEEVTIELDISSAVDLSNHVKLPVQCAREETCQAGPMAYYITHPKSSCDLYVLRKLPMQKVQVQTARGEETGLVSHAHKIFVILRGQEIASRGCNPIYQVTATNYHDVKIMMSSDTIATIDSIAERLGASEVDLDLELRTASEYLSYSFETLMRNQLQLVSGNLCKVSSHTLTQAELSPFHPNALIRVKGEIVQELSCKPVKAEVRIGEKRSSRCFQDALPAWLDQQPVLIAAQTRLVLDADESQTVACAATYAPVFRLDDGTFVRATPQVAVVDIQLTHLESDYLHSLAGSAITHEPFGSDILYTSDEIQQFNDLVHFRRSKELVINSLVQKYCSAGNCGGYSPGGDVSAFSLDNLKNQVERPFAWFSDIAAEMERYGGYCSIFILIISVFTILYRISQTLYLAVCRKVHPLQAVRLTFLLEQQLRNELLSGHTAERPEPQVVPPPDRQRSDRSDDGLYDRMQPPRIVEVGTSEHVPLVELPPRKPALPQGYPIVPYQRQQDAAATPRWA